MKDQHTVAHSSKHPAKQDTVTICEKLDTEIGNTLLGSQNGSCLSRRKS